MESSVLIAIVTAVTSITVALIQVNSAFRLARLKEQPIQQSGRAATTKHAQQATHTATSISQVKPLSLNRTWLWIGGILIVSNLLWQLFLPDESGYIIHLGAIPWCTCLLAYFRPIRWGYVAGVVTVISVIPVITTYLLGRYYDQYYLPILAFLFVVNAIVAAGIAYFIQRNPMSRV